MAEQEIRDKMKCCKARCEAEAVVKQSISFDYHGQRLRVTVGWCEKHRPTELIDFDALELVRAEGKGVYA